MIENIISSISLIISIVTLLLNVKMYIEISKEEKDIKNIMNNKKE